MAAAKSLSPAKRKTPKRPVARKGAAAEEAALMREGEALLAKVNRGLDEAIARADRLLARYE
jgi:hypothetical protein